MIFIGTQKSTNYFLPKKIIIYASSEHEANLKVHEYLKLFSDPEIDEEDIDYVYTLKAWDFKNNNIIVF